MPTPTTRLGLLQPLGPDTVDYLRRSITTNATTLDAAALDSQGTLAARPVSTGGSPGIVGRYYLATDQTPHQLFRDFGTGWDLLNGVDLAPNVPSQRTLGTGHQQALPGDWPGLTKVSRQYHSFTTDDQTLVNPTASIVGSFFIYPPAAETVTLLAVITHCAVVGGVPSTFKLQYDHAAHGTLADVPGLTALSPTTTQAAVAASGGPLPLSVLDRIALVATNAASGTSKGCTVQVVTEHTT